MSTGTILATMLFVTMTHWYSRTPVEFLKCKKRKFLKQYDNNYVKLDIIDYSKAA